MQAAGKLPIDVRAIPFDYLSITGHKIGAPKETGALYIQKKAHFIGRVTSLHWQSERTACTSANRSFHHPSAGFAGFSHAELPLPARWSHFIEVRRAETVPSALAAAELRSMQMCRCKKRHTTSEARRKPDISISEPGISGFEKFFCVSGACRGKSMAALARGTVINPVGNTLEGFFTPNTLPLTITP